MFEGASDRLKSILTSESSYTQGLLAFLEAVNPTRALELSERIKDPKRRSAAMKDAEEALEASTDEAKS